MHTLLFKKKDPQKILKVTSSNLHHEKVKNNPEVPYFNMNFLTKAGNIFVVVFSPKSQEKIGIFQERCTKKQ